MLIVCSWSNIELLLSIPECCLYFRYGNIDASTLVGLQHKHRLLLAKQLDATDVNVAVSTCFHLMFP